LKFVFIHWEKEVGTIAERARFEHAEPELALGNGDEPNDRFLALGDDHVLARERRLCQPRELGLGDLQR
jgi:hypothetical protein